MVQKISSCTIGGILDWSEDKWEYFIKTLNELTEGELNNIMSKFNVLSKASLVFDIADVATIFY